MTSPMQTAIGHLEAAIKIHTGHMNGSVTNDAATEKVEMDHLTGALKALQSMSGDAMDASTKLYAKG